MSESLHNRLSAFFPESDLEWRPGSVTKDKSKGMALAYVAARAVMQRLDDVVGPMNWQSTYREAVNDKTGGSVECTIHIRNPETGEWVGKSDASPNTDIESVKGGYSKALVRAAVHWGIGRYLYDLPTQWVPLKNGKYFAQLPKMPKEFLPSGTTKSANRQGSAAKTEDQGVADLQKKIRVAFRDLTPEQQAEVKSEAGLTRNNGDDPDVLAKVISLAENLK